MRREVVSLFVLVTVFLFCSSAARKAPGAQASTGNYTEEYAITPALPDEVGMHAATLHKIEDIVAEGIQHRAFPGCQVLVMKDGKVVYDACFGHLTYNTEHPVTPITLYDLASLSKTTGTLLAIMKLYDKGLLKLNDKISTYLPVLKGTDKEDITFTELLFHESGLPAGLPFHTLAYDKNNSTMAADSVCKVHSIRKFRPDMASACASEDFCLQVSDSFYLHKNIHEAALQMIARAHLGPKRYVYSCVNFIVLKEIAEQISGSSLDVFLQKEFYESMHLQHTAYLPLRWHKKEEVAPTLKMDLLRGSVVQGYVNDPDAAFLGGVSGNAGLFSTAHDVSQVYQMLLNGGELNGKRYLSEETCKLFTATYSASGRRTLGFDKSVPDRPSESSCCASASASVYGHTGYTGTCCWVDPDKKLIYIFLSNRTYPSDGANKLAAMRIRPRIQELIYEALK